MKKPHEEMDADFLFQNDPPKKPCAHCGGGGFLDIVDEVGLPASKRCRCKKEDDLRRRLEKTWPGLTRVKTLKETALKPDFSKKNLWLTATQLGFRTELKTWILKYHPLLDIKVVSDAELATAWIATAELKGLPFTKENSAESSLQYLTLMDISLPPSLLIIQTGVKGARFSPMPEVLLEAISLRVHKGKPTWVLDHPQQRITSGDHLCFSHQILGLLEEWTHLEWTEGVSPAADIDLEKIISPSQASAAPKPKPKKTPSQDASDSSYRMNSSRPELKIFNDDVDPSPYRKKKR